MCEVERENAKLKEEVEELKKQLVALYRSYEAKKPYMLQYEMQRQKMLWTRG